ncbi:hypothetical protein [Nitrospira sp. M1]
MKIIFLIIFFVTIGSFPAHATTLRNAGFVQLIDSTSDSQMKSEPRSETETQNPSDSIESQGQEVPNAITDSPAVVAPPVTDPDMTIVPPIVDPEMTVNPENLPEHLGQDSKVLPKIPH